MICQVIVQVKPLFFPLAVLQVLKLIHQIFTHPQCYLYLLIALKERFASVHVIDICFQVSNIISGF